MPASGSREDLRAAACASWRIRILPLSPTPTEDLSDTTTATDRLAMMWDLALDAWTTTGMPLPAYNRRAAPIRIVSLCEA